MSTNISSPGPTSFAGQAGLDAWSGRIVETRDDIVEGPLRRLAALLDHAEPPWRASVLPPLGHWMFFLPSDLESELGPDGHAHKGSFLPPITAPSRMWAGSRISFIAPLPVGTVGKRLSRVERVDVKEGRTGRLTFVTLRHEVRAADSVAVVEEQDLVYRERGGAGSGNPAAPDIRLASLSRTVTMDSVALFRFSALTFNAHRIHYDREYAIREEGYAGLVVHGPLQAMLLVDLLLRAWPGAELAEFSFRGVRPVISDRAFDLCLAEDGAEIALWTRDADGHECMRARATLR